MSESSDFQAPPRAALTWFDRVVAFLNAFGSVWVLGIVVLICTDSFGRSFFNKPFDGVNEIVAVSMAFVVFCQLADTIRLDKLTRSDSYLPRLQASRSLGARLIVCGFDVLGMAIMIAIIIGTVPLLHRVDRARLLRRREPASSRSPTGRSRRWWCSAAPWRRCASPCAPSAIGARPAATKPDPWNPSSSA